MILPPDRLTEIKLGLTPQSCHEQVLSYVSEAWRPEQVTAGKIKFLYRNNCVTHVLFQWGLYQQRSVPAISVIGALKAHMPWRNARPPFSVWLLEDETGPTRLKLTVVADRSPLLPDISVRTQYEMFISFDKAKVLYSLLTSRTERPTKP